MSVEFLNLPKQALDDRRRSFINTRFISRVDICDIGSDFDNKYRVEIFLVDSYMEKFERPLIQFYCDEQYKKYLLRLLESLSIGDYD